jgi:hypothetical protein
MPKKASLTGVSFPLSAKSQKATKTNYPSGTGWKEPLPKGIEARTAAESAKECDAEPAGHAGIEQQNAS